MATASLKLVVKPRCPLCHYQHGHMIGCANNPVDIALRCRCRCRCRFRFVHKQGRGGNRRAIYVCVAHPYPNGCMPFATKVTK